MGFVFLPILWFSFPPSPRVCLRDGRGGVRVTMCVDLGGILCVFLVRPTLGCRGKQRRRENTRERAIVCMRPPRSRKL